MNHISTEELLKKLVSIPSSFFHEEEIAEFLESVLINKGFQTHRQPVMRTASINGKTHRLTHHNVLGVKGTGEKSFLLYGHMDTVPAVEAWKDLDLDPYRPVVKDGNLYGLGASDMKAGLVAILKAVDDLEPDGYKIKICFGVDEENDSQGVVELVNSDFLDDCVGCIVPEVGSGNALPAPENLVIGRHGRVRVGIRITGQAAHASTPEYIINPIDFAFETIKEARLIPLGEDPCMPPSNLSIGGIQAMGNGLSSPEECIIWFDCLFSPPRKVQDLFADFEVLCKRLHERFGVVRGKGKNGTPLVLPRFSVIDLRNLHGNDRERFTPRPTPYNEPWKIDPEAPLVKSASKAICSITGKKPVLTCGKSNADENYIGQKVPTVVVPPIGGNEHQAGEYVNMASIDTAARIIKKTIIDFMRGS